VDEMKPAVKISAQGPVATELPPVIKSGLLRAALFLVACLVWVAAFGIVAGAVIIAAGGKLEAVEQTVTTSLGRAVDAIGMLGVLLLIWLFRKAVDRRSFVSLGFSYGKAIGRDLIAGMALGAGIITTVFLTVLAAGGISVVSVQFPTESVVILAMFLALVAVEEEAMCRGYILLNIMQSMNKYLALLSVSLLFSLLHLMNPNPSVVGYLNILLAGLMLGIYYVHKRNLWFPIGVHLTWNFFQGIVFGSPVSGVTMPSILSVSRSGHELLTGGKFGFEASLVTTAATLTAIVLVHLVYRDKATSPASEVMRGQ
jgi:membrane protease YdiL (CAAX protease family)